MDITQRLTGNRGWSRMLRMLCVAAVAVAAAGWCGTAAWAANAADLSIVLASTPNGTVTVSRENLPTYVAYRVTLKNSSTNAINQVRLTGATTANGTTQASYHELVASAGIQPTCTPAAGAGPNSLVTCTIGQMMRNEGSDFFLIFKTPTDGSNLHFDLDTTFSEAASSTSKPAKVVGRSLDSDLALTNTPTGDINKSVQTALPPAGGTFFTGPNGAVNDANPFSSSVKLPGGVVNLVTSNSINQTTVPSFACQGSYFCFGLQSSINVNDARDSNKVYYNPTVAGPIEILLRQDTSTLFWVNGKRKIGDVKIFYNPNPLLFPGDVGTEVTGCETRPGFLPSNDNPCIKRRDDFTNGNTGFYQYLILGNDNGVFSW